jgi:hypothetical protein
LASPSASTSDTIAYGSDYATCEIADAGGGGVHGAGEPAVVWCHFLL